MAALHIDARIDSYLYGADEKYNPATSSPTSSRKTWSIRNSVDVNTVSLPQDVSGMAAHLACT